jgi:hypothetical protein
LWRAANDHAREAITLDNIGNIYQVLDDGQKALDFYNRALPLRRATGDRQGEAHTLNGAGR